MLFIVVVHVSKKKKMGREVGGCCLANPSLFFSDFWIFFNLTRANCFLICQIRGTVERPIKYGRGYND